MTDILALNTTVSERRLLGSIWGGVEPSLRAHFVNMLCGPYLRSPWEHFVEVTQDERGNFVCWATAHDAR